MVGGGHNAQNSEILPSGLPKMMIKIIKLIIEMVLTIFITIMITMVIRMTLTMTTRAISARHYLQVSRSHNSVCQSQKSFDNHRTLGKRRHKKAKDKLKY